MKINNWIKKGTIMDRKYITFAIPSYNSQDYLSNCIESIVGLGEEVEVIVINDGSKDNTLKIALDYQKKYPNIIRIIDKENGGHGSGVNAGIEKATGLYYKVVDSDDWLDEETGKLLLEQVKSHETLNILPDLYILDFIYERATDNTSYIRTYQENFPNNVIFEWNDLKKPFLFSKTLLMHALMFKTSVLKESGVKLPHHTFYVDNLFSYTPLFYTTKMFYIPKVIYHYHIGREDQSVNIDNIVKRYDQQIKVMRLLLSEVSYKEIIKLPKKQKRYIKQFLQAIMIITQMFTTGNNTKERKIALKSLWKDLKKSDKKMYNFLRYRSYNVLVNYLPWEFKGWIMTKGYLKLAKKIKLG